MAADQIQLFVGGINAKSGPGEFINAKKIIIHPNYDSQVIINDLSLIQLAKPVKSDGKTISFLGLPADTPPVGSFAIVSGWGLQETKVQPEIIKKALIPVANRQKCIDLFEGYRNDIQFCGGNGSGKDACQGDSGGPIVIRDSSLVANVIGVTSYGTDTCGAKGSMGVYVRIPAFANWIRQQIGVPTTDDTTEQVTQAPSVDADDSSETSADADE
jgi:trypsin